MLPFSAIGPLGHARAEPIGDGTLWRAFLVGREEDPTYHETRPLAVEAARILSGTVSLR